MNRSRTMRPHRYLTSHLSPLPPGYHSGASPGPLDSMYLFEQFLDMVQAVKA